MRGRGLLQYNKTNRGFPFSGSIELKSFRARPSSVYCSMIGHCSREEKKLTFKLFFFLHSNDKQLKTNSCKRGVEVFWRVGVTWGGEVASHRRGDLK